MPEPNCFGVWCKALKNYLAAVAFSVLLMGGIPTPGLALPANTPATSVSVQEDSGGAIIDYVMRAAEYREGKVKVKFTGRCDSACTLFLSLPPSQLCVSSAAYFRFHAPVDDDDQIDPIGIEVLMRKYPLWIANWINDHGGLNSRLLTMTSADVLPHISTCPLTG